MEEQTLRLVHALGALADLGQEIADVQDFREMMRSALRAMMGALGVRRGVAMELDEIDDLRIVAEHGFLTTLWFERLNLDRDDVDALLSASAAESGLIDLENAVDEKAALTSPVEKFIARHWSNISQLEASLIAPLVVRGELTGAIFLGAKATGEPFNAEDYEVVRAMARHIGVGLGNHRLLREVEQRAIENERLYNQVRNIYQSTVRAFAVAIDCKDKYTRGHSERVGKYCEIIARELGCDDRQTEAISTAGYLHDIGKLVIDSNIINHPAKLSEQERREMHRHPVAGYEMLRPLQHPQADIPLMVRHHHERPDGKGYPDGLDGMQIPLGARVIGIADAFDSMTTDRPYRRRRAFDEVLAELADNAGKQFDAEILKIFCRRLISELSGASECQSLINLMDEDYVESGRFKNMLGNLLMRLEAPSHHASFSATGD